MALEELELLDPSAEREPTARRLAERLPAGDAAGQRIALLDIRKPRGDVFLDELELLLAQRGYEVERTAKTTFAKPAASDLRREIAKRCGAVIEALAD